MAPAGRRGLTEGRHLCPVCPSGAKVLPVVTKKPFQDSQFCCPARKTTTKTVRRTMTVTVKKPNVRSSATVFSTRWHFAYLDSIAGRAPRSRESSSLLRQQCQPRLRLWRRGCCQPQLLRDQADHFQHLRSVGDRPDQCYWLVFGVDSRTTRQHLALGCGPEQLRVGLGRLQDRQHRRQD